MTAKARCQPHGRKIRCLGGCPAHVPHALPPPLVWSAELAAALARADRALHRIQRIDALLAEWRERLATESSRLPERVLDLFVENPFWGAKKLSERLDVAFTTAQRAMDRLESAGIVALATEAKRNRVYCARAILDILEEPPKLHGTKAARRRGRQT